MDIDRLRQMLKSGQVLPKPSGAPSLSYGRHRGPAPRQSREAAVAITLYQDERGRWTIPLTLRPKTLAHHGGQVCLPGGRIESNEDAVTAAMREFQEELGVAPRVTHRLGELSSLYVYASNNLVHPVVVAIESPELPWRPDPVEVEQVIPVPLEVLQASRSRTEMVRHRAVMSGRQEVGRMSFRATAFEHDGFLIWGATALILDQLVRILRHEN